MHIILIFKYDLLNNKIDFNRFIDVKTTQKYNFRLNSKF